MTLSPPRLIALIFALGAANACLAQSPMTEVTARYSAPEARQGVASDGEHFYAIDNNRIGKYRIADGEKVAEWKGDAAIFPHINSCTVVGEELACASSNHPTVPQRSSVEFFSLSPLAHVRSVALTQTPGSLTVINRHGGHWWAVFANYDDRGSPAGKDHSDSYLVQYDEGFKALGRWTFPDAVLERFAPSSCSGASWTASGLLLASGHDRPEIYVLKLPASDPEIGAVLEYVTTLTVESHGQAIDIDPRQPDRLWSIDRPTLQVFASRIEIGTEKPTVP